MPYPKAHILVIDDEEAINASIVRALHDNDYMIFSATTEDNARNVLENYEIDLVICDYYLSKDSRGTTILKEIYDHFPYIVCIFLTGRADETALDFAKISEQDNMLFKMMAKPWDNDELRKTISDGLKIKNELGKFKDLQKNYFQQKEIIEELKDSFYNKKD
jgi:DNA-binding NtrC family response regulator